MLPQSSPLCRLPDTLLEDIAVLVATADPLGPPQDLGPLLRTCKHVHGLLSAARDPHLYGRIFLATFDCAAPRRRLGTAALYSRHLAAQLKTYCLALRHVAAGDVFATTVRDDLWQAHFMLLENDGRNARLLARAGLRAFVDRFVRRRLAEGREDCAGWLVEDEAGALALALLWQTTDYGETPPRPEGFARA